MTNKLKAREKHSHTSRNLFEEEFNNENHPLNIEYHDQLVVCLSPLMSSIIVVWFVCYDKQIYSPVTEMSIIQDTFNSDGDSDDSNCE